jgi:hypothetical protein
MMFNFAKKTTRIFFVCLIIFSLHIALRSESNQCVWKGVDKIVAVGDVHGAYDSFVKILKAAGLVDDMLKWSGGKTHLVQTGDILDRGDYPKDVFDLIKKLEIEALEAGGKVHLLLGNHEEMNITGIVFRHPEYVSAKQFASFLPDDYRKKKENEFLSQLQKASEGDNNSDPSFLDSYFETKWRGLMDDKYIQGIYVNTFNDEYGRWLIEHNTVIKINDIIFSHAGISERYSTWPLQKINDVLRQELNDYRLAYKRRIQPRFRREILYMPDSPLWNRDYALKDEKTYGKVIDKILKDLNANYMIIAHTPKGSPVILENEKDIIKFRTRFDQKIWLIDTGISDYYYGILSYLRIENGKFKMREWREEEYEEEEPFEPSQIAPEDVSREDLEYFLKNAAVVDVNKGAVPGRTGAWKINLDNGEVRRSAMFKVVDETRPERLPDSYKYELAAYALDKLLDFQKIPPVIEREIEDTWGSLQIRIEDCIGLDELQRKNIPPPDSHAFTNALDEINVFENLVYNERTELDDILIQKESWKIYRVDFSEAFSPTPDLIPEQKITRCSKALFQNLQELSDELIKDRLAIYLNDEEMAALLSRKALIIKTLNKLIEEKGKAAVLFNCP